ncbi:23S rRNA (guanosine(2251)-2'-O)-methyltransferase RlmB [Mycoplasma sp. Ms02]|uniref:23S rRNA (guanosine(2251)-2'-O)-methyltransferase RlmB n=1 Tax=Mycoplasma sp. Ms02 TaxID=353851 RepID=UPI001C8AF6EB|nr:23S rRNA (guanosine(2251)-2'-O)-methyltransferase RlmB [Mycoplasma sp. Ms02]QZE12480.1 23S rRNA (guanosine(2251)-2'-O)-methyltransferase RlmB [Mycoplasma sp. Ms02]
MQQLIVCGKNSVQDAIKDGLPILKIWVANEQNKNELLKHTKVNIEIKSKRELDLLTKENHQGFAAFIKPPSFYDLSILEKDQPDLVLILDHIQDPHNFGAIIRSANAAGIKHIIYPKVRAADINETVLKVSSGGFVGMKFIKVSSISATITKLQKMYYWVYASALDHKAQEMTQVSYSPKSAIIVGNEGSGVSKSTLSMVDQTVYIKQFGTVQSLNVSVATGILLFDAVNKLRNEQ